MGFCTSIIYDWRSVQTFASKIITCPRTQYFSTALRVWIAKLERTSHRSEWVEYLEQGNQLISSQQDFKAKQCDPFRLHEKIVLLNYIKIPRTTAMIFHVNFAQTHTHTHSHQGVNDAKNKCVDRSRFETHQNWPQGFGVSFAMVRKNKCTSYCQVTARITLRKSCFSW